MSFKQILFGLMCLALSNSVVGQSDTLFTFLDSITITASKSAEKLSETSKNVILIPNSTIQNFVGQPISKLLSQYAGIFIVGANNNLGTNQDVYLRGAKRGYTLILKDGMPIQDVSDINHVFDLNFVLTNDIETIEILKDGQSTLYGSDAVAGVINLISKKNVPNKPLQFAGSLAAGSFHTLHANLKLLGNIHHTHYDLSLTRLQSDGFSTAKDSLNKQNYENDAFLSNNILLNLKHRLDDKTHLRMGIHHSAYKTDLDAGAFTDDKDFIFKGSNTTVTAGFDLEFQKKYAIRGNYQWNISQRTYLDDSLDIPTTAFDKFSKATYTAYSHFGELFVNYKPTNFIKLLLGADMRQDKMSYDYRSISNFGSFETPKLAVDSTITRLLSSYFSLTTTYPYFGLAIGGRYNHHSIYGNNFTYSVNPYLTYKNWKLFYNNSSAFKVPSLYQLYSPYANKNLKPEQSVSSEIGLSAIWNRNIQAKITYFDRTVKDVVVFQSINVFPYGQYKNFDKQQNNGFEVEMNYHFEPSLSLSANYAYVNGNISTQLNGVDTSYFNLFRNPKHLINININYNIFNSVQICPRLRYVSSRIEPFFDVNTFSTVSVTLKPYVLMDLDINYKFNDKLKFFLNVFNVTNQNFADAYGYSSRKLSFNLGLSFVN